MQNERYKYTKKLTKITLRSAWQSAINIWNGIRKELSSVAENAHAVFFRLSYQTMQARGNHFSTRVKAKNQVLSCNMIRWFSPHPLKSWMQARGLQCIRQMIITIVIRPTSTPVRHEHHMQFLTLAPKFRGSDDFRDPVTRPYRASENKQLWNWIRAVVDSSQICWFCQTTDEWFSAPKCSTVGYSLLYDTLCTYSNIVDFYSTLVFLLVYACRYMHYLPLMCWWPKK